MSDLLSIGATGVRAYQTALTAVGENIANSGVSGYARRTVGLREVGIATGVTASKSSAGGGVMVSGIVRATDVYASAAVRGATTELAATKTTGTWLDRIESTMTGSEVSARITAFFESARSLSAEPASNALRATMLETAGTAAAAITATGQAFAQARADLDDSGHAAARDLTSLAQSLARVNDGLQRTATGTAASAQLADQRDTILSQMSELTDIGVKVDQMGRATVTLGNAPGTPFVTLDQVGSVSYNPNEKNGATFALAINGQVGNITPTGGKTAGIVDSAVRIATAQADFGRIVGEFVNGVNTTQAGGVDSTGAAGPAMFAFDAATLTVGMARVPKGDGTHRAFTGSDIAAAGRNDNGTSKGARDASNLTALQGARIAGAWESKITNLISDNATIAKQKATIADAQTAILGGANTALSTATGVSLDNEAVELMRFQQAYSASSRVIQAARDTFQSILGIN
ncbi:flagellar hook-associated protein FlgK [Sphingomonas carotinifaciens]|uniref:flagellar hook-associated protein FlgK n=1 Tax=Sphingomonas carotinifaciens TaxID=1166323 RepID=UPI000DD80372|nr:flagellar hook-associated protein FlgK [Sphingomonas carotinifaciens]